ncbi:MAG: hypothetical protein AB8E82_15755 [Aureispira sp.]
MKASNGIFILDNIQELDFLAKKKSYISFGNTNEQNIYLGFLFPIFDAKEVEEIYFYSTSLLWGHMSLGVNFIDYCFDKIDNALSTKKEFKIMVNSDINTLYMNYGSHLEMQMILFNELFDSKIYFNTTLDLDDYKLYLTVYSKKKTIIKRKFYEVLIGNIQKSILGVLKFSGQIKVNEISELVFNLYKSKFNQEILIANKNFKITTFETRMEKLKRDFGTKKR